MSEKPGASWFRGWTGSLAHLGSEAGQEVIEKRCANSPKLAMKSVKTR
ncbi:MAG: hypothetical protein RR769_07455 [Anaerovoracaceae bacterium]